MALHMIKLCVGAETVDDLRAWHAERREWVVHTRQTPKRAEELVDGGSLYRVFKGMILCRQKIVTVKTIGAGQQSRCLITVDPNIVLTQPAPRRAFQGWRYFEDKDAPGDLDPGDGGEAVPQDLAAKLRELGAW